MEVNLKHYHPCITRFSVPLISGSFTLCMLIKILRIGTAKVFTVVKLKMEPSDFYNMAMHPFDADGLTSCLGFSINPTALRMAKTLWNFGPSECNRVKRYVSALFDQTYLPLYIEAASSITS